MQLAPVLVTESCGSEAFSVRFSPDDAFLAAAGAQGKVSVYNVSTGQEAYRLNRNETHPVKQVCWRPERADASLRTKGVLTGASTDGKLRQWHATSSRLLQEFGDPAETGQLFCVDYSPDGTKVVAGGIQELWLYDEETKKLLTRLKGGDSVNTPGHSSRVFAVRFPAAAGDSSLVLSGGWDNTVQFWDLRAGHAVRLIYGPHLCGDALDVESSGRLLLTGSWRDHDPLELWDIGSGKRVEALAWRSPGSSPEPRCLMYTARFSRDAGASMIAAGGSFQNPGCGEAKVLDRRGDAGGAGQGGSRGVHCLGTLVRFTCLSADFSSMRSGGPALVALGGHDGRTRLMRFLPSGTEGGGGYPARM